MRIYLDNCCFNRPFDNQIQIRIRLESEAKLFIQYKIAEGKLEFVWSYILEYENVHNPFDNRKENIFRWKEIAILDIEENEKIIEKAKELSNKGIKTKDALHIACAIDAQCEYFLTTDDFLIKKLADYNDIQVINPVTFITLFGDE